MVEFRNKMTEEDAIALYDSKFWLLLSDVQVAQLQLHEERKIMPFDVFQKAVSATIGRHAYHQEFRHGFAVENLRKEVAKKLPALTIKKVTLSDKTITLNY